MPSDAERAYRALEPINLQRHNEYIRSRLAQIGALDPGDTVNPRYPDMFDAPLHLALRPMAADVADALVQLGFPPDRVSALVMGLTADDRFAARYRSFDDDSGLVVVSDSLVSICASYADYLARVFSGGVLRMFGRILLSRWTGTLGERPGLLAGLLRYQIVHRRLYGLPAVLNFVPRPDDELVSAGRDVMLEFVLRFAVGHEAAHHVLRHRIAMPADTGQEQDADALAQFIAATAFERATAGQAPALKERWRLEAAEFHGLLGAVITMLALHCAEQALFVRNGRTHLPSETRAMHLVERVLSPQRQESLDRLIGHRDPRMEMRFDKDRGAIAVYTRNLVIATRLATTFDPTGPSFDWTAFAAAPEVEQPPAGYLGRIAALDRLMSGDDVSLVATIGRHLDLASTRMILAGQVADGLAGWGLPPGTVRSLTDPGRVLAFHKIVEDLRTLVADQSACVAAATLVARRTAEP